MEKQNSFESAMNYADSSRAKKNETFSYGLDDSQREREIRNVQSSNAETIMNIIPTIVLWFGIIMGVLGFCLFITWIQDEKTVAWIALIIGLIILVVCMFNWASAKIVINESRNLFVIKESLLAIEKKLDGITKQQISQSCYKDMPKPNNVDSHSSKQSSGPIQEDSSVEKLMSLVKLRDSGTISVDEFEELKKQI